jgi:uncharacterized phage protein gp47/JayE
MIRKKSKEELLNQVLKGIVQETSITMVGTGSVTRGLASVFSSTIEETYQILDDAVTNSFLPTASGFYLDLFGETFGLARKPPTQARLSASDRTIKFYVNSGTLATRLPHPSDLNKGRVPVGTEITTDSGIAFSVDANYDFPAASKEVFVGAISSESGTTQNVPASSLTNTNLSNGVLVTNVAQVTTGRDLESDEEYRFRISKWVRTSAGRNEIAVRLAVLSAPNVADMIKEPYFAGAGSFRIIVIPSGNRISSDSIRAINVNLSSIVSDGTFFIVEGPRYVPVSISIRLVPAENKSISETDRSLVKESVLKYLGDIRPGESLIVNRLRANALNASRNVRDIAIQGIAINKRPQALVNFTLEKDELFVPDTDIDNPILVA